jgi:hypothetical protein
MIAARRCDMLAPRGTSILPSATPVSAFLRAAGRSRRAPSQNAEIPNDGQVDSNDSPVVLLIIRI